MFCGDFRGYVDQNMKNKEGMSQIFGAEDPNSDEDNSFKVDNEYAKKYDDWRKKEELHKLKARYGDDVLEEDESSSSSDDDEGVEITEDVEKDFFRTLACLKNKDPRIYKTDENFFSNIDSSKTKRKKKDKPVFLKDYERNLILEKDGVLSDEENENDRPRSPTYNEEQKQIKQSFKTVFEDSDRENEDNWGGLFKQRDKTKEEIDKEEDDYKQWLAGQKKKPDDKQLQKDLKPLKEYWNKPDLDDGEKFLRDYILKKKYLDKEDDNYIPTYDEVIHDSDQDLSNDEGNIDKQEEFEHKYNFRYEEPDQDFIKRYPRTIESSLRKTDDRRKLKRQEVKERKKHEKEEKMQEVKKMKELKLKEIEEKLEKLKEITGNSSLGFADEDIDGDFNPEEYDKKMQAMFNDDFYAEAEGEQKPEFPDLDEELEIENWERYNGDNDTNYEPNCEDEDFNMDCDYDPQAAKQIDENVQGRKKRKRKSKFAAAVSKPKPKFDPNDKKFEKYFEEYYRLDCEDIIGDLPCRFKYRKVVPNDFGLTTEEILLANERELNKWCSLKKAVQIRPDDVEKYEQIAYQRKGQNINLKRKILPSLFTVTAEDNNVPSTSQNDSSTKKKTIQSFSVQKIEKKVEKDKLSNSTEFEVTSEIKVKKKKNAKDIAIVSDDVTVQTNEEKKQKKEDESVTSKDKTDVSKDMSKDSTSEKTENGITKSNKKKKKQVKMEITGNGASNLEANKNNISTKVNNGINNRKRKNNDNEGNKRKKQKFSKDKNKNVPMSDSRLLAYGINPKKFKNKLKYKK